MSSLALAPMSPYCLSVPPDSPSPSKAIYHSRTQQFTRQIAVQSFQEWISTPETVLGLQPDELLILFSQPSSHLCPKGGCWTPCIHVPGALAALRAEHPCPCHPLSPDGGFDVTVGHMEGFPGTILQSVCCVTTHVQYKGRGAAAAPPLPVGSSGEILFYGFSGERSQALMCVCQGMRNTLTDREPQGKEERRGPALCKGSVRHPDPASAQGHQSLTQ